MILLDKSPKDQKGDIERCAKWELSTHQNLISKLKEFKSENVDQENRDNTGGFGKPGGHYL